MRLVVKKDDWQAVMGLRVSDRLVFGVGIFLDMSWAKKLTAGRWFYCSWRSLQMCGVNAGKRVSLIRFWRFAAQITEEDEWKQN